MSVFVSMEDKEGEGLAPVIDVDRVHRRFARDAGTVCLRFVSEAEDASFNALQLPLLLQELEALDDGKLAADELAELRKVVALVGRFRGKPGVHARFYGERGGGE